MLPSKNTNRASRSWQENKAEQTKLTKSRHILQNLARTSPENNENQTTNRTLIFINKNVGTKRFKERTDPRIW